MNIIDSMALARRAIHVQRNRTVRELMDAWPRPKNPTIAKHVIVVDSLMKLMKAQPNQPMFDMRPADLGRLAQTYRSDWFMAAGEGLMILFDNEYGDGWHTNDAYVMDFVMAVVCISISVLVSSRFSASETMKLEKLLHDVEANFDPRIAGGNAQN